MILPLHLLLLGFVVHSYSTVIPKVKLIPAAYLKQINDVVFYESHAKIIFKVKLPQPFNGSALDKLKFNLATENAVREMFEDNLSEMGIFGNITSARPKRQVLLVAAGGMAAGYFVHSVFSKISNALFGSDEHITRYINQLQKAVKEEDRNVYLLHQELQDYSRKMTEFQKVMLTRMSETVNQLYRLMLVKIEHDNVLHSIDLCKRKEFPYKLVSSKQLVQSLAKLANLQKTVHKVLAIPLEQATEYLKLPIYDCIFSPTYATVIVSVPLKRASTQFLLYQIFHHKFAFKGQTCSLYSSEASFLATSDTRSVLISSHMLKECNIDQHKLCLIPPYSIDSAQSLQCIVGILKEKSYSQLQSSCLFRCTTDSELSISQVDETRIIVTNANVVDVYCSNHVNSFTLEKLGAVEINLDCNCQVVVDKKVHLEPFYCLPSDETVNSDLVYRAVPTLWSGLQNTFGINIFTDYSNHTIDYNWATKIPTLNLTLKAVDIPKQLSIKSPSNFWILLWLGLVTVAIITISCTLFCMARPYMH